MADIDFDLDTITGMQGIDTIIEGVGAGYLSSDLAFAANQWNNQFNDDEFAIAGTFFEIT